MCEWCNGSHVVHSMNNFSIEFQPCPSCGPIPDEEWISGIVLIKERIAVAKERILRKGTSHATNEANQAEL